MYYFPEVLNGIVKNIIPLHCQVMFKSHSLVELVSSNNKNTFKNEFQIRTKIYPDLPNLQSTKIIIKYSIKFPFAEGGYATEFRSNVRYDVIYKIFTNIRKSLI